MYQPATFQSVATLDTQTRMAMSLGDNRHYVVSSIMPRHFEQTAARCGFRPLKVKIGPPPGHDLPWQAPSAPEPFQGSLGAAGRGWGSLT